MTLSIRFSESTARPPRSMRTHSHRIAVGATLLLTTACVGRGGAPAYVNPHANDEIGTVRQMYDGALSPTLAVNTFRNIDRLFPTRRVAHSGTPYPLPPADKPLDNITFTSKGVQYTADDFIRLNRIAGLLVLKNGRIALEHYEFGNGPQTRWMSMSVAKSITSTLMGAAVRDGKIGRLDDLVTKYVPRLASSAYDGVTMRQLLMMSSGVRWNETYTDSSSDRRHLLEAQIAQQSGGAIELMRSLARAAPPGTVNNYSTGETQIAGEVVRGAVGMSLAQYLHDRIWGPFGMETDATWWLDSPDGHEIGGSGFNATLRDYARFGLFFANGGVIGETHVLPDGWTRDASSPKTLANNSPLNYGYMWWPIGGPTGSPDDGAFAAEGIFGQAIYINRREQVVIAQWGAQTKPTGGAKIEDNDFFAAVVSALR